MPARISTHVLIGDVYVPIIAASPAMQALHPHPDSAFPPIAHDPESLTYARGRRPMTASMTSATLQIATM